MKAKFMNNENKEKYFVALREINRAAICEVKVIHHKNSSLMLSQSYCHIEFLNYKYYDIVDSASIPYDVFCFKENKKHLYFRYSWWNSYFRRVTIHSSKVILGDNKDEVFLRLSLNPSAKDYLNSETDVIVPRQEEV
jgi:hypothetical protein